MSAEAAKDCINEISKTFPAETHPEFDAVVLIMLDRKKQLLSNWWYFSGHEDYLRCKELSDIAQQMTATTAELLKSDANVGQRELKIKTKTQYSAAYASTSGFVLFAVGVCLSPTDATDRLWCWLEVPKWEFGFSASVAQSKGNATNNPFWSLKLLFGPLRLHLTWPKSLKKKTHELAK